MFKKISQLGLVSTLFFSLIHEPTYAATESVQNVYQNASVSGSNNQVYQIINQTIINNPKRGVNERDKKKQKENNGRALGHVNFERRERER